MDIAAFRPSRNAASRGREASPTLREVQVWQGLDLRLGVAAASASALGGVGIWVIVSPTAGAPWLPVFLRLVALVACGQAVVLWSAFVAVRKARPRSGRETMAYVERRKLSLDLHDGAIQPYLGLKLGLEALRRKVESGHPLARDIDELYRVTQDSIAELRGYVRTLDGRPSIPDAVEQGPAAALADGLRRQAERFAGFYGFKVALDLRIEPSSQPVALVDELVRMAGEGLSNAGRHTQSRHVVLSLSGDGNGIVMEISDEGRGDAAWQAFTPVSLTQRAQRLGGRVDVAPRSGGGSVVRIAVPVSA